MNVTRSLESYPLKVMIVDGEIQSHTKLSNLLTRLNNVDVIAHAWNIRSAISQLQLIDSSQKADINVIYLDASMPDASGIAFAKALQKFPSAPAVVFFSAHSEYALDAFDLQAIDFLVKPVQFERLALSVLRVREQLKLHELAKKAERIPVKVGNKKALLHIDEIGFVKACCDYSYLQTGDGRYFADRSLAQLEKTLTKYGFFRVHRSFLVNLDQIETVEPCSGGRLLLSFSGIRDKVPVSRRRASQFRMALDV